MKVTVWSDLVCPFCYIGKRRFETALDKFPYKMNVNVEYKSYELDPGAERNSGKNIHELMAGKFGVSLEKAKAMNADIGRQAAEAGLVYHFDGMQHTNTFNAHRLAKYAQAKGKGSEMTERLLQAYFIEGRHIGEYETLIALAAELGLDKKKTAAILPENDYASHVRADENLARQIGVQGVPFFVFNEKYAVSGAQPEEIFTQVLEKVWQEESKTPVLHTITAEDISTGYCTGNGCTKPADK
jgi:predicted DsbA family dithiol-disulfide isomerase